MFKKVKTFQNLVFKFKIFKNWKIIEKINKLGYLYTVNIISITFFNQKNKDIA